MKLCKSCADTVRKIVQGQIYLEVSRKYNVPSNYVIQILNRTIAKINDISDKDETKN